MAAAASLRETAVVIPVYCAPPMQPDAVARALSDTVAACLHQGIPPQSICLSADGAATGRAPAAQAAREHSVGMTVARVNRGKLAAVRRGVAALTRFRRWRDLAVIDQDGDHFANDLVNLARMAVHLKSSNPRRRFLVIGERISRHRPMGFMRGEIEELADRVLLDALTYAAAVAGRPLSLEHALTLNEFPDFHSGFKLFDRAAAEAVFLEEPRLCGVSETAYYRHAVEAVMTVEALAAGAVLAVVSRRTVNGQPFSAFGAMNRRRLAADKMIWPLRRLETPASFAAQWLANHLGRLLMHTLTPGRAELRRIAAAVIAGCGGNPKTFEIEHPPFV